MKPVYILAWIFSLGLMCLGVLLLIVAPLSRLGLGEPGTGMSMEEFKRINAQIAASPWTPVPFVVTGLACWGGNKRRHLRVQKETGIWPMVFISLGRGFEKA